MHTQLQTLGGNLWSKASLLLLQND